MRPITIKNHIIGHENPTFIMPNYQATITAISNEQKP